MMIFKMIAYMFYMLWCRIKMLKYIVVKKIHGEEAGEKYIEKMFFLWAKFTVDILDLKINVKGIENVPQEPCVFILNHTSILDIPILFYITHRQIGFIAKEEAMKMPAIGYWLKKGHSIPLNRTNPREALKSINEGVENIKKGYSMAIFPEGTRSRDGQVLEFKKGSLKLATKAKAKVVPVAIKNAYYAYEKDKKFRAAEIDVTFGRITDTSLISREEEKELAEKVRTEIVNMLN